MPEQDTEIKRKTTNKEVENFLALGIKDYGEAIANWSLKPSRESTKPLGAESLIIAKSLSTIEIEDSNLNERVTEILKKPEKMTMDDMALVTAVFVGKAEAKNKGFLTPKEKKGLSKLTDTVIDGALDKITGARGRALRWTTVFTVLTTACLAKVTPPTPELIATNEPVPTAYIPTPIPTETPQAKETQIAPSPTQESMKNILLTSVEVMTEEEIQADPLLSDPNFQEGINNYVQETRETRELSEENTSFELVVIRGTTTEGNEMLFPFATWTAQNQEGLTFVDMIGVVESGLVMVTLEHQEIEKDGILYYALVLQGLGPVFAIPASEIDNPDANISFSPSGQALEETESISVSKVLFALVSGTEQVVELDEETIKELARNLNCTRNEGVCVGRSYSSSGFRGAALEAISAGVIRTIDILQPENGNKIAEAEVVIFVTKDLEGNPQLLNIVAQLRPVETPEINVYHWPNWLAKKDFNNEKPYSIEELEELYMKGGTFRFAFYDKDYKKDASYTEIMRVMYSDENYIEQLQQFINNKGYLGSEELLILPSSVVLTSGMVPEN